MDLLALRDLAGSVAQDAADFIVRERPAQLGFATKSSAVDVVTEMDQRAQDRILARLSAARPHDAVLGEERGGRSGTTGITWVVDPIDGTTNYLYGLPVYAVSVAAVEGDPQVWGAWRSLAGAVAVPEWDVVFDAARGLGARRHARGGTRSVRASAATELSTSLLGTGFSYDAEVRRSQGAVLGQLIGEVRDIRRLGSAAVDLCLLGSGVLDAYVERDLNPWDAAAGWLVAAEGGAVIGGLDDDQPSGDLFWGCAPGLSQVFPARVRDAHRSPGIF